MKLRPQKGNGGHVTSYNAIIGSKEARDAGFLNEDKTSKTLKKTVDTEGHRIPPYPGREEEAFKDI